MNLIIQYSASVPYEASWTQVEGVEYESAEAFAVDFENFIREMIPPFHKKTHYSYTTISGNVAFAGIVFDMSNIASYDSNGKLYIDLPEILTVDEWFEQQSRLRLEYPINGKL